MRPHKASGRSLVPPTHEAVRLEWVEPARSAPHRPKSLTRTKTLTPRPGRGPPALGALSVDSERGPRRGALELRSRISPLSSFFYYYEY